MSRPSRSSTGFVRASALIGTLASLICVSCATLPKIAAAPLPAAGATPAWSSIAEGIDYAKLVMTDPPLQVHLLRIDLANPNVEIAVTNERGPKGATRGRTVRSFAAKSGCVAAVNGGPFSPVLAFEGESMHLSGLLVSEGKLLSPPNAYYAALLFPESGGARVLPQSLGMDLQGIRDAVGGYFVVLASGVGVGRDGPREPRTAAGVSPDGRTLYLLVADGRRPQSVGLTEAEVGSWLAWLGAGDGLCLDGGGSSAMCLSFGGKPPQVVNVPVHGGIAGWQRVVGDCLGFRAPPAGVAQ